MANKKVAELFNEIKKQKYIFRIHDLPDKEKLKSLKTIIKSFGYTLDLSSKKGISSSLNKLLKEVKGKQEQNLIKSLDNFFFIKINNSPLTSSIADFSDRLTTSRCMLLPFFSGTYLSKIL